jgi:hypothetical protein
MVLGGWVGFVLGCGSSDDDTRAGDQSGRQQPVEISDGLLRGQIDSEP